MVRATGSAAMGGGVGLAAQDVSVVSGTLLGLTQHGVSLGDAREAPRGVRVRRVVVRVVRLGQPVEGPGFGTSSVSLEGGDFDVGA